MQTRYLPKRINNPTASDTRVPMIRISLWFFYVTPMIKTSLNIERRAESFYVRRPSDTRSSWVRCNKYVFHGFFFFSFFVSPDRRSLFRPYTYKINIYTRDVRSAPNHKSQCIRVMRQQIKYKLSNGRDNNAEGPVLASRYLSINRRELKIITIKTVY